MQAEDFRTAYLAANWKPVSEKIRVPQLEDLFNDGTGITLLDKAKKLTVDSDEYKALLAQFSEHKKALVQKCTFEVRALTANELAIIHGAKQRLNSKSKVLNAVAESTGNLANTDAIQEILNLKGNTSAEMASRLEAICLGTVSPVIDMELAIAIGQYHGRVLWGLSDKIFELSDKGSTIKKPAPSGQNHG